MFHYQQNTARGLAGATIQPYRVYVTVWATLFTELSKGHLALISLLIDRAVKRKRLCEILDPSPTNLTLELGTPSQSNVTLFVPSEEVYLSCERRKRRFIYRSTLSTLLVEQSP